ncbi:MAG: hypothetical protein ABF288_07095, partial [Octadecabacter sp.]
NPAVETILATEAARGDALVFDDIAQQVAGIYGSVMKDGDTDAGAWSCGMVAGLINDVPTCAELIDRIMGDAKRLISDRLTQFAR